MTPRPRPQPSHLNVLNDPNPSTHGPSWPQPPTARPLNRVSSQFSLRVSTLLLHNVSPWGHRRGKQGKARTTPTGPLPRPWRVRSSFPTPLLPPLPNSRPFSIFKPADHNPLLDLLLSRGVNGESPSRANSPRRSPSRSPSPRRKLPTSRPPHVDSTDPNCGTNNRHRRNSNRKLIDPHSTIDHAHSEFSDTSAPGPPPRASLSFIISLTTLQAHPLPPSQCPGPLAPPSLPTSQPIQNHVRSSPTHPSHQIHACPSVFIQQPVRPLHRIHPTMSLLPQVGAFIPLRPHLPTNPCNSSSVQEQSTSR